VSSDTTQGTRLGLVAPPPSRATTSFPFLSFPLVSFLALSSCLSLSYVCHLRMLRRQNWDTDTTTQSIDRVSRESHVDDPFVFFPSPSSIDSFLAFLFFPSSATNRCSSFSSFTSWARVGEGVEEVRPYGPGLPGFVPTLVHIYGVSYIEKCEHAHRYFFQTFNYEITNNVSH